MNDGDHPGDAGFPLTKNQQHGGANQAPRIKATRSRQAASRQASFWYYMRISATTLFCVICLLAGSIAGILYNNPTTRPMVQTVINDPRKFFQVAHDPLSAYPLEANFSPQDLHTMTLLILGCDKDYEDTRPVALKTNGRSDSIMLARFDFDRNTIEALTIPRDTAVHIPDHGYHKINAAHAFGGPALTEATIKSVFGLDTNHYVTMDFDGFKKVVDAVGGVDLTVEKQLDYDDNWGHLHIHLKPGPQHMDGYKAMGYVRMRHSDSDLMRSERQHNFIEAIRSRLKDPRNVGRLPDVVQKLSDSIKSDLTQPQLLALSNWAKQLPREKINVATLPVIEGPSYVYVRVEASAEMIRRMFYDNDPMASVSINVPARSQVLANADGRRSRRRHRLKSDKTPALDLDDNSDNMIPISDQTGPPATVDTPAGSSNTDGASGDNDGSGSGKDSSGGDGNASHSDSGSTEKPKSNSNSSSPGSGSDKSSDPKPDKGAGASGAGTSGATGNG